MFDLHLDRPFCRNFQFRDVTFALSLVFGNDFDRSALIDLTYRMRFLAPHCRHQGSH